jgi:plasmid stabilization system protein ParE
MTRDTLKLSELSDADLREVAALAMEEAREREKRRKQDIIARIKALAAEGGVGVTLQGQRGRPRKQIKRKEGDG